MKKPHKISLPEKFARSSIRALGVELKKGEEPKQVFITEQQAKMLSRDGIEVEVEEGEHERPLPPSLRKKVAAPSEKEDATDNEEVAVTPEQQPVDPPAENTDAEAAKKGGLFSRS